MSTDQGAVGGIPLDGWEIPVEVPGGRGYPVRVGPGVRRELPGLLPRLVGAHRYVLVADDTVMGLYGEEVLGLLRGAGLNVHPLSFPPGEASKTRESWASLTDRALEAGVGRDGAVIALGGGVTGDLAGFLAATYMRGIPLVQVPTSLVAMVDSGVGGKTGVDVPGGKNLVGAFHPPRLVLADTELAGSLPRTERSQGLAEAVKHGAILDRGYFERIRDDAGALMGGEPGATATLVARSVELKSGVVGRDEREGGLRQILNFGHTLGHALEAATEFALPHGSAVATGMVLEARIGEALGVTREGTARELARVLEALELPTSPPDGLSTEAVLAWTGRDKKVRSGRPRYVLLREVGEVDPGDNWGHAVPRDLVARALTEPGEGRG
jgi:3-dehydroquinate synthase